MKDVECVVSLYHFSLVCVEILKPSLKSESPVLVSLIEPQTKITAWLPTLGTGALLENVVNEVSNNPTLKARLSQPL